jgi:hypothetical protein
VAAGLHLGGAEIAHSAVCGLQSIALGHQQQKSLVQHALEGFAVFGAGKDGENVSHFSLPTDVPVEVEDERVAGGARVQGDAGHEANVPNCEDWECARRQVEQNLVDAQIDEVAANVDDQDDDQGFEQATTCLFGNWNSSKWQMIGWHFCTKLTPLLALDNNPDDQVEEGAERVQGSRVFEELLANGPTEQLRNAAGGRTGKGKSLEMIKQIISLRVWVHCGVVFVNVEHGVAPKAGANQAMDGQVDGLVHAPVAEVD